MAQSSSTSIFILAQTDIKGLIPKWLVSSFAGRAPTQWTSSLQTACLQWQKDNVNWKEKGGRLTEPNYIYNPRRTTARFPG
jgi:hypothetical protein